MNETPEEKLLNIIRQKDANKDDAPEPASQTPPVSPVIPVVSETVPAAAPASSKAEVISDFEKSFWDHHIINKFFFRELKNFNLEKDDLILFVVLTLSVILLNGFMGRRAKENVSVENGAQSSFMNASFSVAHAAQDTNKYKKHLSRKNIFTTAPERKKVVRPGPRKEKGKTIDDITKDLKVIGVIMEDDTPRVIIQSRQSRSSKQVGEGQMIDDAKVEKIEYGGIQDRVILSYDGETSEMAF